MIFFRPVNQDPDIRFMMYSISFIISSIFLGATLATGWLLPTSHHVLHWKCQTHHVLSLMLGDILMAIIQLAGDSLQGGTCKLLGKNLFLLFHLMRTNIRLFDFMCLKSVNETKS